ncbi:MAG TPA: rRNA maturation RNase YbeY, partial [Steroidobacteraceae bacterium]
PAGRMHRRRPPAVSGGVRVHLRRATRRGWTPGVAALEYWTSVALGRRARGGELSVLIVGPARSRSLNRRFRGRDHSTNVLSFPAAARPARRRGALGALGDLVICPQLLRREARAQGKTMRAHWMHLVIHGTLHLIGYDHQRPAEAQRMERREARLLRSLGVADPYRSV